MKRHSVKKYFTLLEVMVSMGVFCLLMLALMQFFTTAQGVWEKTGSRTELFDSARMLNQMLQNDLASAFYGDNDLDMNYFRFFKYTEGDPTTRLTFATQRTDGLTAVSYIWDRTDLRIYLKDSGYAINPLTLEPYQRGDNKKENYSESSIWARLHWITEPNDDWIEREYAPIDRSNTTGINRSDMNGIERVEILQENAILENVLLFNVRGRNWSTSTPNQLSNINNWDSQRRPPAIVIVSYAVLSPKAYEKIANIMKMRNVFSDSDSDDEKTTKISSELLSHTKILLNGGKTFDHEYIADSDGRITQERQLIYDNTQFFNIVVPIER